MGRVSRLNDDELVLLRNRAREIQYKKPSLKWCAVIEIAQQELFPEEKWYSPTTISLKISKKLLELESEAIEPSEEMVSDIQQRVEQPQPPTESVRPQGVLEVLNLEDSFDDKILSLAGAMAKQFEMELTKHLNAAVEAAIATADARFKEKLEAAKKAANMSSVKLPRVMIIGTLGEVAHEVESEYGQMLDLRFYKSEENMGLIRSQSKSCDFVVLIAKFIEHAHQNAVRDHPGLVFCNGGTTKLKEILLELACK